MKINLALTLLAAATMSVSAQTYVAPAQPRKRPTPQRQTKPPPLSSRDVSGVIPRAIRGGNPVQMLNPRAPARYGTSAESTSFDPREPGKWRGIKLFTIFF